jgi:hypothetical protein
MRRTPVITAALLLTGLALAGCSAQPASQVVPEGGAPVTQEFRDDSPVAATEGDAAAQPEAVDRQVITTGYVTITVDKPVDAAADAIRIVESTGGRVDGRSEFAPTEGNEGSATLTLRIPADSLDATLEKLRELGDVQEVSLDATDVTMETQDLDARITAMRASVDRLLALLQTATDTENLITLETAISDRQAQLESMESQQRYYADQISLSTVTLNLVSEYTAPPAQPDNFLDGLVAGWHAFVGFFAGLLVAIGVLLPWIILGGVIALVVIVLVKRRRRARVAE